MYTARGFGDSILFMGVLGGVSKFLAGTSKIAQWSRTGNGFVKFGKGVVVDGAALNVAGVTSRLAFDDKSSYSPEEVAQAFIMAGLFRGVGKAINTFKVSREPNGGMRVEPVVLEPTPTTRPAPLVAKDTPRFKVYAPEDIPAPARPTPTTRPVAPNFTATPQPINSNGGTSYKPASTEMTVKRDGLTYQTTATSVS
ncbi:MAG: hypothetical protein ACOYN2_05235 [Patescibacteria group bacterium]